MGGAGGGCSSDLRQDSQTWDVANPFVIPHGVLSQWAVAVLLEGGPSLVLVDVYLWNARPSKGSGIWAGQRSVTERDPDVCGTLGRRRGGDGMAGVG